MSKGAPQKGSVVTLVDLISVGFDHADCSKRRTVLSIGAAPSDELSACMMKGLLRQQ